jgi:hypothetical protein
VTGRAIKAAKHSPQLRKEVVAALHGIPNLSDPGLGFAALGRLQPKAGPPRPCLRGAIAVSSIGLRARQGTRIKARSGRLGRGRLYHQGLQHVLSLTAIVGMGSSHDDSQRHGARVTG